MLKQRARDRLYKRAVGFLVLASALTLLFILRMYQQATGPFDDSMRLTAVAPRADGLEIDSPVTMVGIKIGRVVGINVTPERMVRLELEIQGRFRDKVRADSKAALSRPLIGSAFIDISIGTPTLAARAPGASIELVRLPDINDVVAGIPAKLEKIDAVLANVTVASDELKNLARKVAADGGPVDHSLRNVETITREAADAATKANHALTRAQPAIDDALKAAKQVNAILDDVKLGTARVDALTQKADAVLANAEAISADLKSAAPPLVQSLVPVIDAGRDALSEADDVLRAAKNSFLLRDAAPPPPPGPLPPSTR